jgi:hypothetical protein
MVLDVATLTGAISVALGNCRYNNMLIKLNFTYIYSLFSFFKVQTPGMWTVPVVRFHFQERLPPVSTQQTPRYSLKLEDEGTELKISRW